MARAVILLSLRDFIVKPVWFPNHAPAARLGQLSVGTAVFILAHF
jgi:hypothetical protein